MSSNHRNRFKVKVRTKHLHMGVQIVQQTFHCLAERVPHRLCRLVSPLVNVCMQSLPPL